MQCWVLPHVQLVRVNCTSTFRHAVEGRAYYCCWKSHEISVGDHLQNNGTGRIPTTAARCRIPEAQADYQIAALPSGHGAPGRQPGLGDHPQTVLLCIACDLSVTIIV